GLDSEIYYTGSNLFIDPDVVGSGRVQIGGDLIIDDQLAINATPDGGLTVKIVTDTLGTNWDHGILQTFTVTGAIGAGSQFTGKTITVANGAITSGSAPDITALICSSSWNEATATAADVKGINLSTASTASASIDDQFALVVTNTTTSSTVTDSLVAQLILANTGATITNQAFLICSGVSAATNKIGISLQGDGVDFGIGFGAAGATIGSEDAVVYWDGNDLIIDPDYGSSGSGTVLVGATGDDDMKLNDIEIDGTLNHDGTNVGFYGVAPVVRAAAYTQTYATATRTHSTPTAVTLTDSTGGTSNTTVAAISGTGDDATINDNFADLVAQINALVADLANSKQMINSLVDDSQAIGISQ
ncbi:MAG: hypothetical protein ACXABY_27715, partial [Candidatus Thorarchaeota archaeon]